MELHIEVEGDVAEIIEAVKGVATVTQATANGWPVDVGQPEPTEEPSDVIPVSLVTDPEVGDASREPHAEAEAPEVSEDGVGGEERDGAGGQGVEGDEAAPEEEAGS